MIVNGKHFRTIWINPKNKKSVQIIDQRKLPFSFEIETFRNVKEIAFAIKDMHLRGAGLIGAAGAYGMYLAVIEAIKQTDFVKSIQDSANLLKATRPTAVNLSWAVDLMLNKILVDANKNGEDKVEQALFMAEFIANQDAEACRMIGEHGISLIREISQKKNGETVNILTHCNAGWLAFVDFGSATAPIYAAFEEGIDIHIWVDETRPRNQGARLTSWELEQQGIKHTVITDNAGGYLMQKGMVDMVIVGSDRTSKTGDVANKIGTYLKALAAKDNDIPFYVALPSSTIDWKIENGLKEISIEERNPREISHIEGIYNDELVEILITPEKNVGSNYGFDITPARLVTGLITERGICKANQESIFKLFPEYDR
ncbi:MAG: S-methyl-5-thioribose-1-phosphate isomerase [Bacteroidales bacterium]|jgi:methylthioribose-1-phosphate isomerase|nr:S-methyl-5-thioribose-1-phosphate isomerase [Bacteroidales bacterium]